MDEQLYHYGIKGQKWGVRRYQNPDGSLTPAGKKRYVQSISNNTSKLTTEFNARKTLGDVKEITNYRQHNEVYNEAKSKADDYRTYRDKYNKKRERVWRDVLSSIEKKYGKYEDLERREDKESMEKFDKEYQQELTNQYKKAGVYSDESVLNKKLSDYKDSKVKARNETRKFVNDFIDRYGDMDVKDAIVFAIMADIDGTHYSFEHSEMSMDDQLYHWGIKGMKWGRRRWQNKDGSLTPEGKKRYADDKPEETIEEKKARILNSADGKTIYENRKMFTRDELENAMRRIDTEAKLKDYVEPPSKPVTDRIDKALSVAKSVDSVFKFATESSIGKALMKQMGIGVKAEKVEKFDIESAFNNFGNMTDSQRAKAKERAEQFAKIAESVSKAKTAEDTMKKSKKEAEKELDEKAKEAKESKLKKAMDEYDQYQSKLQSDQEAYERQYGGERSSVYNTRNYYIFESTWRKASNTPITDASRLLTTNTVNVVDNILDESEN